MRLTEELAALGDHQVIARTKQIPVLCELNPEVSYLCWDSILTTRKDINALKDVLIFAEDDCELTIDVIDDQAHDGTVEEPKKIGEMLLDRSDIERSDLDTALLSDPTTLIKTCYEYGADAYLLKPIDLNQLRHHISTLKRSLVTCKSSGF